MFFSCGIDGIKVTWLTIETYRNNRFGFSGNGFFNQRGVQVIVVAYVD